MWQADYIRADFNNYFNAASLIKNYKELRFQPSHDGF